MFLLQRDDPNTGFDDPFQRDELIVGLALAIDAVREQEELLRGLESVYRGVKRNQSEEE